MLEKIKENFQKNGTAFVSDAHMEWLIQEAERAERLSVKYRYEREVRVPRLEEENEKLKRYIHKLDPVGFILNEWAK